MQVRIPNLLPASTTRLVTEVTSVYRWPKGLVICIRCVLQSFGLSTFREFARRLHAIDAEK